jgi:alkylation response protein AidB-like acyl-CoA dehydrogenase
MLSWRWRNQKAPVEAVLKRVANEGVILVSTGGADWLQGSATAVKADGGYRVTGRKIFCSGAPAGSLMMTTAVYDDPAEGATVLQIGVPISAAGVKIQDNWRTLGMRATGSHDITLDDVFVPDAAVSLKRKSGKWHPLIDIISLVVLPVFNSVYVGVAEAARDTAIELSKRKRDDRTTQALAGEMDNELTAAQLALARMIDLATTAQPGPAVSAEQMRCRALLGRSTRACVDKAMELAGGNSFFRANKLERLFRDVQGVRFHPLQDKPQAVMAGRHALGLSFDE